MVNTFPSLFTLKPYEEQHWFLQDTFIFIPLYSKLLKIAHFQAYQLDMYQGYETVFCPVLDIRNNFV